MKFSKEIQIGTLTLLALFILYFGFNYLKGSNIFSSSNMFYIIYDRIEGLDMANSVTINGLKVGQVEKIKLLQDRNDKILVAIEINKEIRIPFNSKALLTDGGLLGDKIIAIQLSDQQQYYLSKDTLEGLKDQNLTAIVKTRAIPLLTHLDSTIVQANAAIRLFVDQKENINQFIINVLNLISRLDGTIRNFNTDISQILKQTQNITANLAQASQKLPGLVTNLDQVSDSLKQIPISSMSADLQKSMADLSTIITNLKNSKGSLGLLLNDDSLYRNLNTLILDIDKLMVDFKAHPKRYVHFSIFGKKDK